MWHVGIFEEAEAVLGIELVSELREQSRTAPALTESQIARLSALLSISSAEAA